MPSTTTATSAPATAGSSPSGSTRSGTSTPLHWRARRPARRGRPRTRRPGTRLRWKELWADTRSHRHRAADRATPIRHPSALYDRHTATSPGGTMATPIPATPFADPAPAQRLERAAAALTAHGFTVEILDDAAAARTRINDLIPEGASVFTGASETLRLSGIDADINTSGRYQAIKSKTLAMDRLLILNAEPHPGRGTVLLLREAIGF